MSGFHQLLLDGNSGQFTTNPHLLTKTHFISFSLNIYTEDALATIPAVAAARLHPPSMGFEATKQGIMFCNGVATIWHLKLIAEFNWLLLQKSYPLMRIKDFTLHGKCPYLIVSPICFVLLEFVQCGPVSCLPSPLRFCRHWLGKIFCTKASILSTPACQTFSENLCYGKEETEGELMADGVVFVVRLLLYWWLRSWSNDKLLNS